MTDPNLTIYRDIEQGSPEWLDVRLGVITASLVGKLIGIKAPAAIEADCPKCPAAEGDPCVSIAKAAYGSPLKTFHPERAARATELHASRPPVPAVVDNETSRTAISLLVAERINGWSDPSFFNADMARGHDVEPIARDWYAEKAGVEVEQVGFMTRRLANGHTLGFSPDGLVGEDGCIEIKAPRARTHMLTHLSGQMPEAHMAQVQAGMLVADRDWCQFISFYGGMPPFIQRIERDEAWTAVIEDAVADFEFKAAEMQSRYTDATAGLSNTDRLVMDMEIF